MRRSALGLLSRSDRNACRVDRLRPFSPLAGRHLMRSFKRLMKALVYLGPGKKSWDKHAKPKLIDPTDAVVRVTKTTLCGTDLHILKGGVGSCTPGRILGHEGVGVIENVGSAVTAFKSGDKVLISCISACAKCEYCRKGMFLHCTKGGWILGNTIDGTQAEFVRIPLADTSLYPIPDGADEEALVMLSDLLPTGFECGVLNGKVQPARQWQSLVQGRSGWLPCSLRSSTRPRGSS